MKELALFSFYLPFFSFHEVNSSEPTSTNIIVNMKDYNKHSDKGISTNYPTLLLVPYQSLGSNTLLP
jgi:hypothetical protein